VKTYVTGANGFIGSHLIALLLERGHSVVGLVRPTSDTRSVQPLQGHASGLRLVVGDLTVPATLGPGLEGVEVVFHLGALLMGTSEADFQAVNHHGTRNLVAAVRATSPNARLLYASSLAAAGPSPSAEPIDEQAPYRPVSWYGQSKVDAERYLIGLGDAIPWTIVRPSAVYGERERDLSGSTFPAIQMGLRPRIGVKEKIVSFVYVRDLVEGMLAAANSAAAVGKVFFLSNPQVYTSTQITSAIESAMGPRFRLPMVTPQALLSVVGTLAEWAHFFTRDRPMLTRDKAREVKQRFWACSAASAKAVFNWTAATTIEQGMVHAVSDWRQRSAAMAALDVPARERAVQTYVLAVAFGFVLESVASLGNWYAFTPHWLVFPVIVLIFGLVMGTASFLTAKRSLALQFALGALVGLSAELANAASGMSFWHFSPFPFGWIHNDWIRAVAVGLPAGAMPPIMTALVRSLYAKRRRLG